MFSQLGHVGDRMHPLPAPRRRSSLPRKDGVPHFPEDQSSGLCFPRRLRSRREGPRREASRENSSTYSETLKYQLILPLSPSSRSSTRRNVSALESVTSTRSSPILSSTKSTSPPSSPFRSHLASQVSSVLQNPFDQISSLVSVSETSSRTATTEARRTEWITLPRRATSTTPSDSSHPRTDGERRLFTETEGASRVGVRWEARRRLL